jgi:ubiquinone/menaquinone biosynthesis C-methylase UbiE
MNPEIVETTISPWKESAYFADAEKLMHVFWNEQSAFYQAFKTLDLTTVVELACGKGRHSEQVAPASGILTLVDVFPEHLIDCITRLKGQHNVAYVVCNGYTFDAIASNSQSAFFCYDAMVHFAPEIVASYLQEISRVLMPGGRAVLHHSNYDGPQAAHYGMNPHARNRMSLALFAEFAKTAGLKVESSIPLGWGGVDDLDGLTVLTK